MDSNSLLDQGTAGLERQSSTASNGASKLEPLARARAFVESLRAAGTYDAAVLDGLTVEAASRGRVVCRLPVTDKHANRYGTMHGGCIATLVDVIGTVAIATVADRSGVSLSIAVNYLSPGPVGGAVEVESTVAKSGKQVAMAAVELRNARTGARVAFGTHTKAMVPQSDLRPLWALAGALGEQGQEHEPPQPQWQEQQGLLRQPSQPQQQQPARARTIGNVPMSYL